MTMKSHVTFGVLFALLFQCLARPQAQTPIANDIDQKDKPKFCRDLDCPNYTMVSKKEGAYELRKYDSARWVSTNISGISMKKAGNKAFMRLYDYITGENVDGVKIDMTAPVINHVVPGEGPLCDNNFTYSFFVPFKYQESGPPEPTNKDVYLSTIGEHEAYVREFSGFAFSAEAWVSQAIILEANLTADGLIDKVEKSFFYTAGYDAPFRVFNRHNEIWYFVKKSGGGEKDQKIFSDNKLRWIH